MARRSEGSVGYAAEANANCQGQIWLERVYIDTLRALRGPTRASAT
jgi:hypothetical protein